MTDVIVPSASDIRARTHEKFGQRPCLWQIEATQAILRGDRDVVSISATGSGKTLTFWMPLLFRPEGIQIIVAPLNILGTHNVQTLQRVGIPAIGLTGETATHANFRAIQDGQYRVVITNPEVLMKEGGGFEALWKTRSFTARIISIVWDEAHCISRWGDFRPEYKQANRLRLNRIPPSIPYYVTSATLPTPVLDDVSEILQLGKDTLRIHRSNDRPNIHLCVREIQYPLSSFLDLAFLIPPTLSSNAKPPKFLIFFDDISESVSAAKFLRSRLPKPFQDKLYIAWFNADMTAEFRETYTDRLREGHTVFGLCCTDSFGMGIDLPDIELVVQWRMTTDLCLLWQRFGRGARDSSRQAIALIFVESRYFDRNRLKKAQNKAKKVMRDAQKKRAALEPTGYEHPSKKHTLGGPQLPSPSKITTRLDTTPCSANVVAASSSHDAQAEWRVVEQAEQDMARAIEYFKSHDLKGPGRMEEAELGPAEDDFVNAATCHFQCYRRPVMLYFGNPGSDSRHLDCDPTNIRGCLRCQINPPSICCELCNPGFFCDFAPSQNIAKSAPIPSRSRLKDYTMGLYDKQLKHELHSFRVKTTIHNFGAAFFEDLGPSSIMPDDILQRIVDCAHHNKINTKDDLVKETKWDGVDEYGDEVIRLIRSIVQ